MIHTDHFKAVERLPEPGQFDFASTQRDPGKCHIDGKLAWNSLELKLILKSLDLKLSGRPSLRDLFLMPAKFMKSFY